MDVAILHFHLNRGGVTQVIVNHLRALSATEDGQPVRVLIVHGGRCQGWPGEEMVSLPGVFVQLRELAGMEYEQTGQLPQPQRLADELAGVFRDAGFSPATTVLHLHNHSLGKSASLPGAIWRLAEMGYPLLLQLHDFAEDFRPENYLRLGEGLAKGIEAGTVEAPPSSESTRERNVGEQNVGERGDSIANWLYPQASHVHYATLNGRDRGLLANVGVDAERLHLLPNPVAGLGELPQREEARRQLQSKLGIPPSDRYVLYPVRGIRRKNLGEALLWSALAGPGWTFGLTLAPLNELERPRYEFWVEAAKSLDLPFRFDVGGPGGLSFSENVAAADLVLTTSVAEGFGMVFLEPWLAGLSLAGRDLPEITADYRRAGLRYAGLAERFEIPLDALDRREIERDFADVYGGVLRDFGRPLPSESQVRGQIDALLGNDLVDFASLRHNRQHEVLVKAARDSDFRSRLRDLNPVLATLLGNATVQSGHSAATTSDDVQHNAAVVREEYSLDASGRRLRDLYGKVLQSPRADRLIPPRHGESLLDAFLDLGRLHPLRTEP